MTASPLLASPQSSATPDVSPIPSHLNYPLSEKPHKQMRPTPSPLITKSTTSPVSLPMHPAFPPCHSGTQALLLLQADPYLSAACHPLVFPRTSLMQSPHSFPVIFPLANKPVSLPSLSSTFPFKYCPNSLLPILLSFHSW